MKKTLYQILAVSPDASKEEITAAYQRATQMATRQHAPGQSTDPNATLFLREAYQILVNDAQRAAYDASLARAQRSASAPAADGGEPMSSAIGTAGTSGWIKWSVAIVLVVCVIGWWQARKPVSKPGPTIVSPTVVETVREAQAAAPSSAPAAVPRTAPVAQTAAPALATQTRTAEDIFEQLAASVARVNVLDASGRSIGSGSGVVIGRETVITNCHVAVRAAQLSVKVGKQIRAATVSTADEEMDLCRLHVAGLEAAAVEIGTVASLRTGQKVFTIGAPQGLDLTISEGIVSSLREVPGGTVVQTTAPISPGSSGGGLFNSAGQLVGITTFQHRYGQNLNFALPADWINQMQSRSAGGSAAGSQGQRALAPSPVMGSELTSLIVGKWWCYGPLTGRNGEYTFGEDGTVGVVVGGKAGIGQYAIRGKALFLRMRDSIALAIDEITAQKMILHAGEGWRLVCERR